MTLELIFVTGGVRSGKSSYAVDEALRLAPNGTVSFVATAGAPDGDADMAERVAKHRRNRPPGWHTIEADLDLTAAIRRSAASDVILLDCVTQWVSRLLLAHGDPDAPGFRAAAQTAVEAAVERLLEAFDESPARIIVVTNEVGSGVAPTTRLGNVFADALGTANRRVAEKSDRAYLLASGLAVQLK